MGRAGKKSWRNSVRRKVNLTIASVFLVVLCVLAVHSLLEERHRNLGQAITQLKGMNAFYFDSLNTLMLADAMEEREALRLKMLELPGITEVRVARAPAVSDRFGAGLPSQQTVDELDRRGLAGESVVAVDERDGRRVVTVVEPYRLTADTRGTDCLECHRRVEPGTVAGAIRLSYSLEQADAAVLQGLLKKFLLLGALCLLGLWVLSSLMHRLVRVPIGEALGFANAIAAGDLDNRIEPRSGDETGQLIAALRTMQSNLRGSIEHDRRLAAEGLRIKMALDSSGTATTVTDADDVLIYMNEAAQQLFATLKPAWGANTPGQPVGPLTGQPLAALLPAGGLRERYDAVTDRVLQLEGEIGGRSLRLDVAPVFDDEGRYQGRVTQWADLTRQLAEQAQERVRLDEERRVAAENQRIRAALDQVSANVMLIGAEREIVYANCATRRMLRDAQDDFRRDSPGFTADAVLGQDVDILLGGGARDARSILPAQLAAVHEAEFAVGPRTFRLVANPVHGKDGSVLGTTLEWSERTAEVRVEQAIDRLVEAARAGDLDQRIATAGWSGFYRQLGEGFNRLLDELVSVFDDVGASMERLADGDLGHMIEADYRGRFGQVKNDVNRTLENLDGIVAQLQGVADRVHRAAGDISSGNRDLSARTERQAANLEETVANIRQLTGIVRDNAAHAQQADQASDRARQAAQRGGQVVTQAVEAMAQISAASERIAEITGVIDEIAFQTNLLALNASVEAARAGEQGRGFAVVASEVRNLASRSAESAREIKVLIQDAGAKVQVGSGLVHDTGRALDDILANVRQAGDLVTRIAASGVEQAGGIDQVSAAVTQIDEATQQNAALAERASAASDAMTADAAELMRAIGFFRT